MKTSAGLERIVLRDPKNVLGLGYELYIMKYDPVALPPTLDCSQSGTWYTPKIREMADLRPASTVNSKRQPSYCKSQKKRVKKSRKPSSAYEAELCEDIERTRVPSTEAVAEILSKKKPPEISRPYQKDAPPARSDASANHGTFFKNMSPKIVEYLGRVCLRPEPLAATQLPKGYTQVIQRALEDVLLIEERDADRHKMSFRAEFDTRHKQELLAPYVVVEKHAGGQSIEVKDACGSYTTLCDWIRCMHKIAISKPSAEKKTA